MIKISKGTPPHSFTTYASQPGATFDDMPTEIKADLRRSLLNEQGYICAYCMTRLEDDPSNTKIEHFISRHEDISKELLYDNLFVVCKGNEGADRKAQTCDTKKANQILTLDPKNNNHISTLNYKSTGIIFSDNKIFDLEINSVLNLNYKYGYLINNRKDTLVTFKKSFLDIFRGTCTKSQLKKIYDNLLIEQPKKPFLGIILKDLEKKLKK